MKEFFSNLFGRNHNPESIVSFDVIDAIYNHLYNQQNSCEFKMKGIHNNVFVNLYSFPGSFNYEEAKNQIEKSGFKNAYEVLNELYKKVDIGVVSEESIQAGFDYDYIHIQFYTEPTPEIKKYLKHVLHNFIIVFCCTNSTEINDFKLLYSGNHFVNYTREILETEGVDLKNPKSDIQKIGFEKFEIVLQGICQYLKIEIPETVALPSQENLLPDEIKITVDLFEEFIRLVSRGDIEEKVVKKESKTLFKNFKKFPQEEYSENVYGHFDFFEIIDSWSSDWKFDPEDAESFISDLIGEDLNFEYPEETYSHNLFPYIQSALEKRDLELMTYETYGDSYLFFVANKNEVGRILELSEIIKIPVVKL
ncbi:hypothetical protein GKZ90_0011365 [Flavobacterium sp. MC2016-06]|uniref:DUF6630 family protein n=1 Tax=Flavobacterium sp. MC2016-06 TaxID=2676308 RepID=UPI0012BAF002|nr:hypothetical protein [Flavobacterium sp. MC2016-06]MBU3858702.1 hypothetical protein [Flavobacterium sp. MC2016-06]